MTERYIAALDIGTTTLRCFIFNTKVEIIGKCADEVILHYPEPGFVEIDPDELWESVKKVINGSLKDANLKADQLTCLSISTQRSTFTTWSKKTGRHFHRLITWKDLRADSLVKEWNESFTMKGLRTGALALYTVLRNKRYLAGSVLKLMNTQTTLRLVWAMNNIPALKKALEDGDALFGTLDCWLLYKLTGGGVHITDASSAAATGLFDPFTMHWAGWALGIFSIPSAILPTVVDCAGNHFTKTHDGLFEARIPITVSMADQSASLWGSCCFEPGDLKITMGTGTFLNVNTGSQPHASASGLYPLVAWKLGKEVVYMAEGANNDTGSIVKWGQSVGLFKTVEDTADEAISVPDSDGVYFVPAFSGLGPPINDSTAATGFIGLKPSTSREHMVRSVLEAIVFRTSLLLRAAAPHLHSSTYSLRLDGGVSNNDFVAQLLSDVTSLTVQRPTHTDMSALGCVFMAGLHLGIWKSKEEIKSLYRIGSTFKPHPEAKLLNDYKISRWLDATKRFGEWYEAKSNGNTATVGDSSRSSRIIGKVSRIKK